MRNVILSLMLAAAGVAGLASATPAQASDARIFVDLGDVVFSYGRPYWRYGNEPLYVVYERGYPRYYRYDRAYSYYAPPVYYAPPPPPRYYAPPRYDHHHRYDRHDRRDHRRGNDRRWR